MSTASHGLVRAQRDVHGVRLPFVGRPCHVRNRLKARGADAGLAFVLWSRDHETGRYSCDVAICQLGTLGLPDREGPWPFLLVPVISASIYLDRSPPTNTPRGDGTKAAGAG